MVCLEQDTLVTSFIFGSKLSSHTDLSSIILVIGRQDGSRPYDRELFTDARILTH